MRANPTMPSRRTPIWRAVAWRLAFLFALGAVALPAVAQQQVWNGKELAAVEFRGLTTLSEDTVLFYLELEPGTALDTELLDERVRELWSRGLVDDIRIDAENAGTGVKLIVTITERPTLRSVEYVGLKRLSRTDIDDRVSGERIEVREGYPISRGELERLKALIEEMYQEKGFRFARTSADLETVDNGEVRVTLTVDEGDKVRIGDIRFEGNTVFSAVRMRFAMKKTKESGVLSKMLKKDIYNPATLDEDLEAIRDLYASAGYKNVLLGEPRIAVEGEDKDRRLVLTIPIEEGERWRFGDVSIEGSETFSEEQLLSLFELRSGSWLRNDKLDEAVENIDQAYRNAGYIFSRVEPELVEREGEDYVADLIVHVSENDQFKVNRIEFAGNRITRDKVLRRELRLYEGLNVNLGAVKTSIFKVNQLGFFKIDETDPVEFDPDTETKTVDLVFKGEETRRTELQFGAGWSDFDGFFGQVQARTANFRGRGETVGVSVQSGRQRDIFDISYFKPWFLDRPQSIGFQLFNSDIDFQGITGERFIRESLGAVLTYGRSFKLFNSFSISYNRSRFKDQIVFLDGTDGGEQVLRNLELDNSSIRPTWLYNSVDNRFEPTRGQRIKVSTEYAGGALGGDNYFIRPDFSYTAFFPLTRFPLRTVFGLNIEAGVIEPFGTVTNADGIEVDRELSPLDRYFLGGENSIRGHRFRSIFVRDADGGLVLDPTFGAGLGGTEFFQANVEFHILTNSPFRIILFADGGNVFGDFTTEDGLLVEQSIDFGALRWTAGAELRLLVPILGAPLRFIYAVNLDEQVNDEFDSFRFSIGTSF